MPFGKQATPVDLPARDARDRDICDITFRYLPRLLATCQ
jgi:hypothetical protein